MPLSFCSDIRRVDKQRINKFIINQLDILITTINSGKREEKSNDTK